MQLVFVKAFSGIVQSRVPRGHSPTVTWYSRLNSTILNHLDSLWIRLDFLFWLWPSTHVVFSFRYHRLKSCRGLAQQGGHHWSCKWLKHDLEPPGNESECCLSWPKLLGWLGFCSLKLVRISLGSQIGKASGAMGMIFADPALVQPKRGS